MSGFPTVSLQLSGELKPDITGQLQKSHVRERASGQAVEAALASFEQSNQNSSKPVRRVASASEVLEISKRRQELPSDEQLSLNTRKALKTFADNTPSLEQQLGVDLAGIDILV